MRGRALAFCPGGPLALCWLLARLQRALRSPSKLPRARVCPAWAARVCPVIGTAASKPPAAECWHPVCSSPPRAHRVEPRAIENPGARTLFEQGVRTCCLRTPAVLQMGASLAWADFILFLIPRPPPCCRWLSAIGRRRLVGKLSRESQNPDGAAR